MSIKSYKIDFTDNDLKEDSSTHINAESERKAIDGFKRQTTNCTINNVDIE